MPRNSSNAERDSEERACTVGTREAIQEGHEPLLRSIAVLVSKTGRDLRWPQVMEIASEVLHEAVQEDIKHADRFGPEPIGHGVGPRHRREAAPDPPTRGSPSLALYFCGRPRRGGVGGRARAALYRVHRRGGRRTARSRAGARFASPPKSGGPSNSDTTRAWTEKSWQPPWGFPPPGPHGSGCAEALGATRTHFTPAEEGVFP